MVGCCFVLLWVYCIAWRFEAYGVVWYGDGIGVRYPLLKIEERGHLAWLDGHTGQQCMIG